jgi:SSS family solute:Na+ symporter
MMDHARSAMTLNNGHAYGANHLMHMTVADPLYVSVYPRPSGSFIGARPSSVSGIGVPTSISFSEYLDSRKGEDNDAVVMKSCPSRYDCCRLSENTSRLHVLIPGMVAAALGCRNPVRFTNGSSRLDVNPLLKHFTPEIWLSARW